MGRLDYHPTTLPPVVQVWLANLKTEADAQDIVEPTPLSAVESDMYRILREEMDIAVDPIVQDGIFTLHLVMGKVAFEALDRNADYFITPMPELHTPGPDELDVLEKPSPVDDNAAPAPAPKKDESESKAVEEALAAATKVDAEQK